MKSILSELDHFLGCNWTTCPTTKLSTLSGNLLKVMQILITHVQQVLERDYPDYELVVSQVHDYYNLPISTFACKDNTLVIHISFLYQA